MLSGFGTEDTHRILHTFRWGTELIVRDVEDCEFGIPLNKIDEQMPGTSLMPVGLVDKLTRPELVDLVRLMTELGKPGLYAATTARIVRRWETLQPTEQSYKRLTRTSDTQTIADDQDGLQSRIGGPVLIPSPARLWGERVRVRGASARGRNHRNRSPSVWFANPNVSRPFGPLTLTAC